MPTLHRLRRRGQVLIMVTLALFVLCGMLGLVVDLGWSYFTKKSAQAAADAAALAAVKAAMDDATNIASYTCGSGGAVCVAVPTPCPGVSGNLQSACLYAERHGFETGERQLVTVQASDRTTAPTVQEACGQGGATVAHPPTADPPCVDTFYWVTVRVTERIPQLFSSIFGNTEGVVSARATAAVARAIMPASLILINRENDPWTDETGRLFTGNNLYLSGTPTVRAPGGIILASGAGGPSRQDPWAGFISGGGTVDSAGGTYIRDDGWYFIGSASGSWTIPPVQQQDNEIFWDPYEGMAQPPLTTRHLTNIAVPNGELSSVMSTYCQNGCPSGNYFAVAAPKNCKDCDPVATGDPIVITQNMNVTFDGGTFGEFYFYGGLEIAGSQVNFGPGRYVFAGTKDPRAELLNVDNASTLLGGNGSDLGRLFILTDSQYPGLSEQIATFGYTRQWGGTDGQTLTFAKSSIQAGNTADSYISLYSLSQGIGTAIPSLEGYEGFMIWQDRRNSYVHYRDNYTYVDETCGDLNHPCYNYNLSGYPALGSTSPQLELWATPYSHFDGVIYQPRGAWTRLQAAGNYNGPLRIVSGALLTGGSGILELTGPTVQTVTYVTALVE
ncbi:MAG: pilus assembly protein TadG-related protein [Bryobacteraceae bacterium]